MTVKKLHALLEGAQVEVTQDLILGPLLEIQSDSVVSLVVSSDGVHYVSVGTLLEGYEYKDKPSVEFKEVSKGIYELTATTK